ncbi:MAG: hypothetical protein AABZ74_04750 [Cyanobacteriota bacterium]
MEDKEEYSENMKNNNISKVLFFTLVLVFFTQFSFFSNSVSQTVEIWPIIYAKDNDAANGIRLSQTSYWTVDNKYYNYGNLYFRISNTLERFNPLNKSTSNNNLFSEESDKNHHFTLMYVSLLSIYGISFLFSFLITKNINQILISMILINTIFMTNKYWMSKIFGVHPDLLLCFFICLGMFLSIKLISNKVKKDEIITEEENYKDNSKKNKNILVILSGFVWGLALSVKLSALFFLPALALLFLPLKKEEIKENISDSIKFFSTLFITYFISGFPQNFEFVALYNFIKYQSAYSIAPTSESFNEWWELLYNQYIIFLPFIFLLVAFFSEKNENEVKITNIIKIFVLSFVPFCFLLSRNITSPHEHYTLPVVTAFIIFTTFLLINLKKYLINKEIIHFKTNSNIFIPITLIISLLIIKYIPNAVSKEYDANLVCKEEAKTLYNMVKSFQINKLKTHVDPYVPFNAQLGWIKNSWFKTFDDIVPNEADVLVLSKKYYSRYTSSKEATHYIKQDTKNFDKIKEFYTLFENKDKVTDKYGQDWEKVFFDNCGWEVWKRKILLKSQ